MKTTDDTIIYQKYLDFIYYTNDIVRKYPKSEKFALVEEIKSATYGGFKLLMYALKVYNRQEKLKYLNELDITLKLLQVHMRISFKYKYISMQNYSTWSGLIAEIGKMVGGWIGSYLKK
jgi:hypothetical protein